MATNTQNRIIDNARITCPGSLDGMINMTLFDVQKEFFARSNCWLFQAIVPIIATSNDYIIETGQPVVVNRLIQVERPRTPPPLPPKYLPMDPPQYLALWDANGEYGTNESINPDFAVPRSAVLLNAGIRSPIMRIRWNPMANEYWIVTVALNISDPTDSEGLPKVPDWILDKYYDYLCSGVKSRLMLQPGKGYSSTQGAAFHGRKFNEGVGLARTEVRNMFTYGGQRWAFPQGYNYRRPRVP
jgi:hypothetical protein